MFLLILVYISVFAFIILSLSKAYKYAKMPMHGRWELYPVPKEKGRGEYGGSYYEETEWWKKPREVSFMSELKDMLKEMLFIKNLFVNQRPMWWFSYSMHLGFYLLFGWALLLLFGGILEILGISNIAIATILLYLVQIVGALGFILVVIGSLGLLYRRMTLETLKIYTVPQDYFNLIFILAIGVTGVICWLGDPTFSYGRDIVRSFLTFSPIEASGLLVIHIILVCLFLIYVPLTKLSHYVGKYFTFHKVLWENEPNLPGSEIERKVQETSKIKPKVTWSAPHISSSEPQSKE